MNCHACGQKYILIVLAILTIVFGSTLAADLHAYAQKASEKAGVVRFRFKADRCRNGIWLGSGWIRYRSWIRRRCRIAAISDNPKMQSRVFIFVGMVESIAIYGIVMMFIILGQ